MLPDGILRNSAASKQFTVGSGIRGVSRNTLYKCTIGEEVACHTLFSIVLSIFYSGITKIESTMSCMWRVLGMSILCRRHHTIKSVSCRPGMFDRYSRTLFLCRLTLENAAIRSLVKCTKPRYLIHCVSKIAPS